MGKERLMLKRDPSFSQPTWLRVSLCEIRVPSIKVLRRGLRSHRHGAQPWPGGGGDP